MREIISHQKKDRGEYTIAILSILWGFGLIIDHTMGSMDVLVRSFHWFWSVTFIVIGSIHFFSIGRNKYIRVFATFMQTFLWLFVALLFVEYHIMVTRSIIYVVTAGYCAYVMVRTTASI